MNVNDQHSLKKMCIEAKSENLERLRSTNAQGRQAAACSYSRAAAGLLKVI